MRFGRPRKLTRVQVAWLRRASRKSERLIVGYEFPTYLWGRLQKRLPDLSPREIELVERGLREWFICCACRWGTVLGMPSRAVDEAWHEFILDTRPYSGFCMAAFGEFLHHMPDEAMTTPMGDALGETVRAWDRSEAGQEEESVLWDLDRKLGIAEPLGIDGAALAEARSRGPYPAAARWVGVGYAGGCGAGGGGGDAGGGCSGGGGGCGGGGS